MDFKGRYVLDWARRLALVWLLMIPLGCGLSTCAKSQPLAPPSKSSSSQQPGAPERPAHGGPDDALFVEVEDFRVEGEGFRVVESPGIGRKDRQFASGGLALASDVRGSGTATYDLDVPGGDYRVWLRVSTPPNEERAGQQMTLSLLQAASVRATRPIVLPVNTATKGKPAVWTYEWLSFDASLEEGALELSLEKPWQRVLQRVDCILLTREKAYVPDYRDFGRQVFLRVHYHSGDHPSLILSNAASSPRRKRGPLLPPIQAGSTSDWVNITRLFGGALNTPYPLTAKGEWQHAVYTVDLADAPDERSIVHSVRRDAPGADLTIVFPGPRSALKGPAADFEIAESNAELVKRLPKIAFGRRPTRFPVITDMSNIQRIREREYAIMDYVGINGTTGLLSAQDLAAGLTVSRLYNSVFYPGEHGFIDLNEAAIERDVERDAARVSASPTRDRVRHLKLMDEAQPPPLHKIVTEPVRQSAFVAWLRDNKLNPFEGSPAKATAEPRTPVLTADRNVADPGLYYFSQRFRAFGVTEYFRKVTSVVRRHYPAGILATQNLSDGAVLAGNMYFQGNDYFQYFENKVLDVALSEDWTNAGASRELCGWNAALLRAATRKHRQPIHMYLIAHSNRAPLEVKVKAMSELAQGVKLFNFYQFAPPYEVARPGWSVNPSMYVALAELAHEIGAAEDVLVDAEPRAAQTAILYSVPGDIWSAKFDTARGFERMFTFLALRHAQVPVDILSDEHVSGGQLSRYRVLYAFDEQLPKTAMRQISSWVRAGGTLVLGPSAASRDHFNRAEPTLEDALHLPRSALRAAQVSSAHGGGFLDTLKASGSVWLGDGEAQGSGTTAFVARQDLTAEPGASIRARFSDGGPAALEIVRGKGKVVLVGFFPAISYVKEAVDAYRTTREERVPPLLNVALAQAALATTKLDPAGIRVKRIENQGQIPFSYAGSLREFIVGPALRANVERPVIADRAQVEVGWLEGPGGWAIPLANYTGAPVPALTLTFGPGLSPRNVRSARQGEIEVRALADGRKAITLPLESTDLVYAPTG